jgi:hypothetical protein
MKLRYSLMHYRLKGFIAGKDYLFKKWQTKYSIYERIISCTAKK